MGFRIIPYVMSDGAYSMPDSVMASIFSQVINDGIFEKVFFEGRVKSIADWLALVKRPQNVIHVIWEEETGKPAMVAWLNQFGPNYAFSHFFILKGFWGKHTKELGEMTLKYWFDFRRDDGTPLLDVIMGQTPENNPPAGLFIRRIGMKVLGTIPKILFDVFQKERVGAVFSYIEREDFCHGR